VPKCPQMRLFHISMDNIVTSAARVKIPENRTVPQFCWSKMDRIADLLSMTDGTRGTRKTHGDIQREAIQFGGALQELGMKKGDILSVILLNCPEFNVVFFGANMAGVIVSPLNPSYTAEEIAALLDVGKASYVVTEGQILNKVVKALELSKTSIKVVIPAHTLPEQLREHADQGLTFLDFGDLVCNGRSKWKQPKMDPQRDLSILPFSSGTTGLPKGVMLSHYNLVANLVQTTEGQPFRVVEVKYTSS
ncbi:unnamed protein product, partial [Cyprideis torosa]